MIIDFVRNPRTSPSLKPVWVVEGSKYGRPFRGYYFGSREHAVNKAMHQGIQPPLTVRAAYGPDGKEVA